MEEEYALRFIIVLTRPRLFTGKNEKNYTYHSLNGHSIMAKYQMCKVIKIERIVERNILFPKQVVKFGISFKNQTIH